MAFESEEKSRQEEKVRPSTKVSAPTTEKLLNSRCSQVGVFTKLDSDDGISPLKACYMEDSRMGLGEPKPRTAPKASLG